MLNLSLTLLFINWFFSFVSPTAAPAGLAPVEEEAKVARNELAWSAHRRLTWTDFAGAPDSQDPVHALTSTNIDMKARCVGGKFQVEVKSVFLLDESWSKNKNSEPLLLHEQLHFDLTELFARQMRKELNQLLDACGTDHALINPIATRIFNEWKTEQDRYDEECHHGLDKKEQQRWANLIALRLGETVAYEQTDLVTLK